MTNTFEVKPTPKRESWLDKVDPVVVPSLRNTSIKKVGDKFIATAYGLQDLLNLQIGGALNISL